MKKDIPEKTIGAFKRRFGDFQSSAKATRKWGELHFDLTEQKLHELQDVLQKTGDGVFDTEGQNFIDKAI